MHLVAMPAVEAPAISQALAASIQCWAVQRPMLVYQRQSPLALQQAAHRMALLRSHLALRAPPSLILLLGAATQPAQRLAALLHFHCLGLANQEMAAAIVAALARPVLRQAAPRKRGAQHPCLTHLRAQRGVKKAQQLAVQLQLLPALQRRSLAIPRKLAQHQMQLQCCRLGPAIRHMGMQQQERQQLALQLRALERKMQITMYQARVRLQRLDR